MDSDRQTNWIKFIPFVCPSPWSIDGTIANAGGVGGEARTVTERRMEWEGADPDPRYLVW